MTNEEAIKNLLIALEEVTSVINNDDVMRVPNDAHQMKKALDIAIKAIEKQIPKKPGVIDGMRYCTACNTQTTKRILMGWEKCCPDCGQRIDLRGNDDSGGVNTMLEKGVDEMTIAEKVLEDNKDCNIFAVMETECPGAYGFHNICDCDVTYVAENQKKCLMCWTRRVEKE